MKGFRSTCLVVAILTLPFAAHADGGGKHKHKRHGHKEHHHREHHDRHSHNHGIEFHPGRGVTIEFGDPYRRYTGFPDWRYHSYYRPGKYKYEWYENGCKYEEKFRHGHRKLEVKCEEPYGHRIPPRFIAPPEYSAPASYSEPFYTQEAQRRFCREYTTKVQVGTRRQDAFGTACQNPDGSWEIIE